MKDRADCECPLSAPSATRPANLSILVNLSARIDPDLVGARTTQETVMAIGTRFGNNTSKWQDWINLILAVWLFISPWVLGFYPGGAVASMPASWTAWVLGIIVAVFSIAALNGARPWEEWINLIAGVLLFISPLVFSYYMVTIVGMWNALIVGALVFILSIWDLNTQRQVAAGA
jgi:hypothetical protein